MMIKNAKQKLLALATALTLTLTMAGCTAQSTQETESAEPQQTQEVQQTENAAGGTENVEIPDAAEEVAAFDPEYSDRDKSGAWDESEAVSIALSDGGSTISGEGAEVSGNVVTVTQAGVYVLSGLLSNGRIVVEAGDEDKVQVVLSGASITSSDGPAIWVKSADKVFLTLAEGTENALADGETYAAEDDANACVWAECDLTINGSGKLKVQGNDKRGISSKDELIITGGDITVNAVDDGLRGKDGVGICGGTMDITAGGDGLDSNGGLYVTGGTVTVCGPTSGGDGALDYSGDGVITGGTVVALGSQSMAQNFDANSTQASVLVNFDNAIAAGAVITVQDEDGNEILRVTGTKQAQCMVISSPDLAVGKTYTILADGEQVTTFEAAMSTETGSGFGGFRGFGGGMQKPDGQPGSDGTEPPELPDGAEMPELPDGQQPPEKPDGQSGGAPQESESTDQM